MVGAQWSRMASYICICGLRWENWSCGMAEISLHMVSKSVGRQSKLVHIVMKGIPARKGKAQFGTRTFAASACFTFANVPLAKANAMAKPRFQGQRHRFYFWIREAAKSDCKGAYVKGWKHFVKTMHFITRRNLVFKVIISQAYSLSFKLNLRYFDYFLLVSKNI